MHDTPLGPDFTEEINAGVAFLDARLPGWFNRIDTARLALSSPDSCVLGQLAMADLRGQIEELGRGKWSLGYWGAVEVLGIAGSDDEDTDIPASYGFNLFRWMTTDGDGDYLEERDPEVAAYWEALTLQWGHRIDKLRAEAGTLGTAP